MSKDEMKNKISMALKDPILQQGFEIVCKENAELRTKTAALENANRAMVKELDDMTSGGVSVLENVVRSKEQLTKAKNIIRDYKIVVEGDHTTVCSVPEENRCINVLSLNEQAEQFLKEVDE